MSIRTISSNVTLLRPSTCQKPVIPGFISQKATTVPDFVSGKFVWKRRTRTDKRHVADQHAEKLRDFIETGSSEKPAYPRDPRIRLQFKYLATPPPSADNQSDSK